MKYAFAHLYEKGMRLAWFPSAQHEPWRRRGLGFMLESCLRYDGRNYTNCQMASYFLPQTKARVHAACPHGQRWPQQIAPARSKIRCMGIRSVIECDANYQETPMADSWIGEVRAKWYGHEGTALPFLRLIVTSGVRGLKHTKTHPPS